MDKNFDYLYKFNTKMYADVAREMDKKLARLLKAMPTRHLYFKIRSITLNEAMNFLGGAWADQVDQFIKFMETKTSEANVQNWTRLKRQVGEDLYKETKSIPTLVNRILDYNAQMNQFNPKKDRRYYSIVYYSEVQ